MPYNPEQIETLITNFASLRGMDKLVDLYKYLLHHRAYHSSQVSNDDELYTFLQIWLMMYEDFCQQLQLHKQC